MKTSLKTIVCRALDDQDVQGTIKVDVAKVSEQAYDVQITVDDQYRDDVDEMYIYDVVADTDYCDCDINIEVVTVTDTQDKLDYVDQLSNNFDSESQPEDSGKSEEEILAETDDLHVFDINEDVDTAEYAEDADKYLEDLEDLEDLGDTVSDSDYTVTWNDVEDFEKEFGEYE